MDFEAYYSQHICSVSDGPCYISIRNSCRALICTYYSDFTRSSDSHLKTNLVCLFLVFTCRVFSFMNKNYFWSKVTNLETTILAVFYHTAIHYAQQFTQITIWHLNATQTNCNFLKTQQRQKQKIIHGQRVLWKLTILRSPFSPSPFFC